MKFQKQIDKQLGNLLAFIIMSERQIQNLRKKLAGNEQFHSRLVFQAIDAQRNGEITPAILRSFLLLKSYDTSFDKLTLFCRKYSLNGDLSYDQFLKILIPKTNKVLAQRMMIRNARTGATLPKYLMQHFVELLINLIRMNFILQQRKQVIQKNFELNHLQMVQFFKKCLKTERSILNFINSIYQQSQFEIDIDDIKLLSLHVKSKNDISDFTDEDIKEIICPIDMNFKRKHYKNHESSEIRQVKTVIPNKTRNFLTMNYQKTSSNFSKPVKNSKIPSSLEYNSYVKNSFIPSSQLVPNSYQQNISSYQQPLYLDNFIKPERQNEIQLDKYISRRSGIERFSDDLQANQSNTSQQYSNGNAFIRY